MFGFGKKLKNRRFGQKNILLDVKLRSDQVRATRMRWGAIALAVSLCKPGDTILIAGKGHEKYQEIKGVRHPFDDKQVLEEFFKMKS